jgi:uncharacterized protein YjiS (DUF1127 family)
MSLNYLPEAMTGIGSIGGKLRQRLAGMAIALRRLRRAYGAYRSRRATVMLLRSLDERTLADLGFDRSEIMSAALDARLQRTDRRRNRRIVFLV